MASGLHETLVRFNRKERYILLEWALGATDFPLADDFRRHLHEHCDVQVPERAFVAMDYHLDWLYAAVELTFGTGKPDSPNPRPAPPKDHEPSEAALSFTQEDIDLLVVFVDHDGMHRVLLIEAKGYSGWSNPQLRHKARRLGAIFGPDGNHYKRNVQPQLILTGPKEPAGIKTDGWPDWAAGYKFMPMPGPLLDRRQVMRCMQDGTTSKHGDHWKIVDSPWGA